VSTKMIEIKWLIMRRQLKMIQKFIPFTFISTYDKVVKEAMEASQESQCSAWTIE
jgi:hypothetical protein